MKIAIFGNHYQIERAADIAVLLHAIEARGLEFAFEREFYASMGNVLPRCETFDCHEPLSCDVALSLGGDGTFLTTVMWVAPHRIPALPSA